MWFTGDNRGAELIAKVTALQKLEEPRDVLSQFYSILTTLDEKASGLLTVDTLFIAILSVLRTSDSLLHGSDYFNIIGGHPKISILIDVQLGFTVFSAFLCMLVVRVTWRFYRWVPDPPSKASEFEREIEKIAKVIDDRTHYYWLAWMLTLSAFVVTLGWGSWLVMVLVAVVLVIWTRGRG